MSPIEVNLPKTNQTGKNEWADVEDNDLALKAGIKEASEQAESATAFKWYTPKVIATEESRTNTSFGTLTTPDEIKSVVVPENGIIRIGYIALAKSSISENGELAAFVGSEELPPGGNTAITTNEFRRFYSSVRGLERSSVGSSFGAGTVMLRAGATLSGGMMEAAPPAGTYNVSVQYKASSGSITAKERRLWVAVLG